MKAENVGKLFKQISMLMGSFGGSCLLRRLSARTMGCDVLASSKMK